MGKAHPISQIGQEAGSSIEGKPPPASAPTDIPAKPADNVPLGIAYMIAATVLFAGTAALAKLMAAIYPVGEVMFFRSFSSLVVSAAFVLPFTGFAVFATKRPRDHLARGISQSISQTFTVLAVSMMPLAGAIAINFSAPLWSALLSVWWLKERPGPARWIALLTGFVGVLIVTHPGADSASDRRLVRARQCHHVRQRHRRGPRHDGNRSDLHPADVADGDDGGPPLAIAAVWISLAGAGEMPQC